MNDPNNSNIIVQGPFYRVSDDMSRLPIRDYLDHGFETKQDFYEAASELVNRWRGREGECIEIRAWHGKDGEAIDQRHKSLRLRFHDTPGGYPDEAWIPMYLLEPIPTPEYAILRTLTPDELITKELDEAFGFD